ncbi:MAG: hypothetical protein HC883_05660 [Bdellovibrionaceae bacterium]|nr:hypothetical protein [Pseudobdellovibrionaceae bacterium]
MPSGLNVAPRPFVLNLDEVTFNIGPVTQEEPPPVTSVKEATGLSAVLNFDTTEKIAPVPTNPAAPPTLKVVPDTAKVQKPQPPIRKMELEADESAAINAMFAVVAERYKGALIMKCSEQNAKIYKWDQTLNPVADSDKTTVNLSYPTFMRIVSKTNLPYHGYLVDSPAHREFFKALGMADLPACVTAIPIRFDGKLWGLVVAFGGEKNQKMDSLNFVQDQVEKLVAKVGAAWSNAS